MTVDEAINFTRNNRKERGYALVMKRSDDCVHCSHPRAAHSAAGSCPGSAGSGGKSYSTMNLPEGKTCGDCVHLKHCVLIYGHLPEDEACDWFPVRFRAFAQAFSETMNAMKVRKEGSRAD